MIASPPPAAVPEAVELFARVLVGDGEWTVQVERAPEPAGHRLRIACAQGCFPRPPPALNERVGDFPISLLRRSDDGPLLHTLWGGGSAYGVRVYALSGTGATRVLETSTLGLPDFGRAAAGADTLVTTERLSERSPPGETRQVSWTWNGRSFDRRPTPAR